MRQIRRPGNITGVDATLRYNRIVHSLVVLITRNEGLSLLPLLALFKVIQQMNCYVRTEYVESETFYDRKRATPYQGTYQDNGTSPMYWLIMTMITVITMYK